MELPDYFSKAAVPLLQSHLPSYESFNLLAFLPTPIISFDNSRPGVYEVLPHFGFDLHLSDD